MKTLALLLIATAAPAVTLRYWVEPCEKPQAGCRPGDAELAEWAMNAWQSASGGELVLEKTADREKAHIRIYWSGGREGLYGRPALSLWKASAARKSTCCRPPRTWKAWLRETIVYLTCLHETGHALGLPHTDAFADIMYSFQYGGDIPEYFGRYTRQLTARSDIRRHAGISPADKQKLLETIHKSPR